MDIQQLETILAQGEDSQNQFKRNITELSREEIQRMFQAGGLVYAEETLIPDSSKDLHSLLLGNYIQHRYGKTLSEDIEGSLINQYERALSFITRNLHRVQAGQGVNSLGKLEIPEIALQEVLVNALTHRDYFISAPIRILMFTDRVEIISPGHLPNHLTIEQIRFGLSNMRNPIIASHATRQMPYRGLGSGIPRALESYAFIQFGDYATP
ncbi:MAG: ATP-binding protein [Candidatus Thiothrix putei]|uniref:ATP-binding protein n=1 Tax=Candidatus Thiothrix putei TaxID=3080811 RepID=A0AA95HFH0_9GAMM|nr:MAG: ATP-binding protein [Candidatus Thiothrix putei]